MSKQAEAARGVANKQEIYAMITRDVLDDPEMTMACISILAYALANTHRVVSRAEITSRFKIGKQTYYDSLELLEKKGYCVRVDAANYEKGTFGFTSVGHFFYKYPINSLKWLEVYSDDKDQKLVLKYLYQNIDILNLDKSVVGLMKDTIVGLMEDTCGSNEGHYSGSNGGHIINRIDINKEKDIQSIAKSDTEIPPLAEQQDRTVEKEIHHSSNASKKTKITRGAEREAATAEGKAFSEWFSTQTQMKRISELDKNSWAITYDKLIKIGYAKMEVVNMCKWAINDDFWKMNFLSANKLLAKNKDKVAYHEYFMMRVREDAKKNEPQKTIYNEKPYNPTGSHLQ